MCLVECELSDLPPAGLLLFPLTPLCWLPTLPLYPSDTPLLASLAGKRASYALALYQLSIDCKTNTSSIFNKQHRQASCLHYTPLFVQCAACQLQISACPCPVSICHTLKIIPNILSRCDKTSETDLYISQAIPLIHVSHFFISF